MCDKINYQISDMLCADLADAVKQQFRNPHRKQMLMDLLGTQFKRSYLADEEEAPQILVALSFILIFQLPSN
jgi:hypothetical protein